MFNQDERRIGCERLETGVTVTTEIGELLTPAETYGGSTKGSWRSIDWAPHEYQISVAGRVLNYIDIGRGAPILLLHGHGSSWQYWLEIITSLAPHRRVIVPDLPGFGASQPYPLATVSIPHLVARLIELLDRLGISECDLAGHSMGSIVGLEIAAAHPDRVRTLTLAGGPATSIMAMFQHPVRSVRRQPRLALAVLSDMITAGLPLPRRLLLAVARYRWLRRLAFNSYVARPADLPADTAAELMKGVGAPAYFHIPLKARRYQPAAFEAVDCPVMVVNGDVDAFVPRRDADSFFARMPHAQRYTLAGAGHLVTVEYPQTFTRLLTDFTTHHRAAAP
jgi:pimeloyl-ACP methyl ester carboxylesterase